MSYAISANQVFTGFKMLNDHAIIIDGEKITAVVPKNQLDPALPCHDYKNQLICASFLDLQLNGCGGVMFNGAVSEATLETMHQANLKGGTTTFLPTLVTCSSDELALAFKVTKAYQQRYPNRVPGLHLEGPFISTAKKGIHTQSFIRPLQGSDVKYLIANKEQIALLTLAPENASPEQINQLTQAGIRVALGHSNASYDQTQQAFSAGAGYATHIYNAMSGLKGRELGVLGAIFDSTNVYGGIIADGLHMDFAAVRIAKKQLGEHLYLVTDATAAANSDIKTFEFVGRTITVENGRCLGSDGTLGGSSLSLNEAVRNCVQSVGISLEEALRMATLYPARAIGVEQELGTVEANSIANLAVINPKTFEVHAMVNEGKLLSDSYGH
ncbi:N-acetylglucosamine-6-phosphate deacetylase [Celerinatantimonas diazotrophica]|uniref:N-acetylglucosamine 6-phosphate deacetylase n=1 Tax=Celerinatantimonas diazotrophica TaxID=412034 RepID=A0A4R1J7X8_9GAMM|nr:N-acetylglucosamine-6-phosphate deacetylase [Celerinatantimonas diazotrophica]TCK46536.1 N-acetylglucosamine 6-phosphate deacetylase [Celerinatantimonas diazotrophica]CAG9296586.1 N-acetylglucosamine-6-phosphate deacetylase [Celerinatantimonas diazotrophica]